MITILSKYIERAEELANLKLVGGYSERGLAESVGMSKSEVHRMLAIQKLPNDVKQAAIKNGAEKYCLVTLSELPAGSPGFEKLYKGILTGKVRKFSQCAAFMPQKAKKDIFTFGSVIVTKVNNRVWDLKYSNGTKKTLFAKNSSELMRGLEDALKRCL